MEFDELKNMWEKQPSDQSMRYSESELLEVIHHKMSVFDKKIRRRDWLEIAAGILVIIIFTIAFFQFQSWWVKLGCATIVFSGIGIIYILNAARLKGKRGPDSFDKPMGEQLQAELHKVTVQKKLLKNIVWWYLLPFFTGLVFFTIGMKVELIVKIIYLGLMLILYGYIWKMSQTVVGKRFDPIIKNLNEAIRFVEKKSD